MIAVSKCAALSLDISPVLLLMRALATFCLSLKCLNSCFPDRYCYIPASHLRALLGASVTHIQVELPSDLQ